LLLLALLTTLRLNTMTVFGTPWSLSAAGAFLSDLGFVAAFEAGWLLLERAMSRRHGLFLALFFSAHLFIAALELVLEQFFLVASERLTPSFLLFTVVHPPQGAFRFAVGTIDRVFLGRALAYVAGLLVIRMLLQRTVTARRVPSWGVVAIGLGGLVVSFTPVRAEDRANPYGRNLLFSFFSEASLRPASGGVIRKEFAAYSKPDVIGPRTGASPNILMFILESTRTDLIGPDPTASVMPFTSSLLKDGVVFSNAYAGVTHTSKALSVIHCGMFPRLVYAIDEARPGDHALECLPDLLSRAGYATGFWQSAYAAYEHRTDLARNFGYQEITAAEGLAGKHWAKAGELGIDEQAMTEPLLKWMVAHRDHPFFASALTVSTHHPYQAPGMPLPATNADRLRGYRAAAANADVFIHQVVNGLREAGLLDDTVILIVGDHGEGFVTDHPGYGGHDRSPFEEVIHIPLGIYGPRWVGPARIDDGLRHQIDILPTVLDLAGVPWSGQIPGENLLTSAGHPTVFSSCFQEERCLVARTGSYVTIYEFDMHPIRVYDVTHDPTEVHDLAPFLRPDQLVAAEHDLISFKKSVDHYFATTAVTQGARNFVSSRETQPMPEPRETAE
jgi:arylsulfatase A-like enzyme